MDGGASGFLFCSVSFKLQKKNRCIIVDLVVELGGSVQIIWQSEVLGVKEIVHAKYRRCSNVTV